MEEFRLPTPESVDIEYDIAGIGTRFLASSIDTVILGILLAFIAAGSLAIALAGKVVTIALILWLTLSFVVVWGYYIIFETLWSGQTPGKRAVKIRVIKTSGYPIGLFEASVRNVVRVIDFLPSLYGLGVVVMFISRRAMRLGDYAAGTIVVKERVPVRLEDMRRAPNQGASRALHAAPRGAIDPDELEWDLSTLSSDDVAIIVEYLDRAPALTLDVRRRIGLEIAESVATRIRARSPLDPVLFLERIVYFIDNPH